MTIREIAALTNVSPSTVSKILNRKDENISEKTRNKVLDVIKKYQYVPYEPARRSGLIGLMANSSYPGFSDIAEGVQRCARENGYSVLLSLNKVSDSKNPLKILQTKRAEGAVVLLDQPIAECLDIIEQNYKIPLVFIHKDETSFNGYSIVCSTKSAAYTAVNHLICKGHNRIGLICGETWQSEQLQKGYKQALGEAGLSFQSKDIFTSNQAIDAGQIGAHSFLYEDVTAIVCENCEIACYVYRALQSAGIKIPQDMSIISAEDSPSAMMKFPPLTAVQCPDQMMGVHAVKLLCELLDHKTAPPRSRIGLHPIVIERSSVAAPSEKKASAGGKIVVIGSMNMDINISVSKIPSDGETILSNSTVLLPGGKGANQAVGVGRLGGRAYAIGRLGGDSDGRDIYTNLLDNSVHTDGVVFDSSSVTGKAYINVAHSGESSIVIYRGANTGLSCAQVRQFRHLFDDASYCLLSMEIPLKPVAYALECCKKRGVQTIVKPAAVDALPEELLEKIDYLIPNEKELHILCPGKQSIEKKAEFFFQKGIQNIIVTLGNKGCYLKNAQHSLFFPAADFSPTDTTGACDAFISALAVKLAEGGNLVDAIGFATFAAGISITRQGVQPAMADRMTMDIYHDEIMAFTPLKSDN